MRKKEETKNENPYIKIRYAREINFKTWRKRNEGDKKNEEKKEKERWETLKNLNLNLIYCP